jgi:Nucleotide-diphospho-sugar transferase
MMRERAKFWMTINSLGIPFFWIDSDIVLTRNPEVLLKRPDVMISDIAFQLDALLPQSNQDMIEKQKGVKQIDSLAEPCGGFFHAKGAR